MKNEKVLLFILAAIQFTSIMDFMVIMPLGPQLMRLFDITPHQFAMLVSAYTLSASVSNFASAAFVDHFDRKHVLMTAYVGFVVSTLGCALAPTYMLLMVARLVSGLFGGVLSGQIFAIVGDLVPLERRAGAMGIVMTSFSAATIFGVPFGLYIATLFGWHATFLLLTGMSLVILALSHMFVPNVAAHISERMAGHYWDLLRGIARHRNQFMALLLMGTLMATQFMVVPFISPYMVDNVGFTEFQLTYIYLIGGITTSILSPVIGRLADKFGRTRVFVISALFAVIPIFLVTHLPRVAIPVALLVTTLFFVSVSGRFVPAIAMITATVQPRFRGGFMGMVSCVQHLAAALASILSGVIVHKAVSGELLGYSVVGYVSIGFSVASLIIVRFVVPLDSSASTKNALPELSA
ncbi:MAG: MFS transporter [Deltaproteobacteria bacterium CG11_big_fil_rev_8_21_14_0_20_47_16]|nr:MAG: MFS transporter [Deltaproteobacteria bacterium CG11_big_fil_rev_8_21_14_0_20_47_16]